MRVLVVSCPLRGHINPMLPLIRECAKRGHIVDFAANKLSERELTWLKEEHIIGESGCCNLIELGEAIWVRDPKFYERYLKGKPIFVQPFIWMYHRLGFFRGNFDSPLLEIYPLNSKNFPDVVIAEIFSGSALDFAESRNIPSFVSCFTLYNEFNFFPITSDNITLGTLFGFTDTELEKSIGIPRLSFYWYLYSNPFSLAYWKKLRNEGFISICLHFIIRRLLFYSLPFRFDAWPLKNVRSISKSDRIYLTNSVKEFNLIQNAVSKSNDSLVYIGVDKRSSTQIISKSLLNWLDTHSNLKKRYIVYVAMGTLAPLSSSNITEMVYSFMELVKNHRCSILWTLNKEKYSISQDILDKLKEFNDDINLIEFAPQLTLLEHGCIKVFVSHCGASSTQEAIQCNVPLVCLPQFGDQIHNSMIIDQLKLGINVGEIYTRKELTKAVQTVVNDSEMYKDNQKKMFQCLMDAGGTKKGVDIIEQVVMNNKLK